MLIGMHGHVAGDVVEDVGLGQIVQLVGTPNGDGGGETAVAQAIEEHEARHIPADCFGLKARQRTQETIYVVEVRDAIRIQAQGLNALQKMFVRVTLPARTNSRVELPPSLM